MPALQPAPPRPDPPDTPRAGAASLLRPALVLLWLVMAPVLCLLYLKTEPSPDQTQFDYMGWMATQGHPVYAGSFDMNWPGGMLLQEAAIRLFGPHAWSWHLLDFLLMQGAAMAGALFLWRAGFRLAPWIALTLYPPLYVTAGGWMAGQRDIVAMGLLVIACCAMLTPAGRERGALLLAGALVACAMLIRPTYLSVLAGLAILEALPRGWTGQPRRHGVATRLLCLFAGFLLVILLVLAWAVAVDNLDDWHQQSILFATGAYYGPPPQDLAGTMAVLFLRSWHWLTLSALLGLALWIGGDRGLRYPVMLVLGLGLAILLSYTVQNKGFGYHLGGFLPLMVLLAAVVIDRLAGLAAQAPAPLPRRAAAGAAIALSALAVLGTGSKLAGEAWLLADVPANGIQPVAGGYGLPAEDQSRMIAMIRAETTPDQTMLQYGTAYSVPYLSQRLPPHRFITPAIEVMRPDFPLHDAWMAEIRDGLRSRPPVFVLITGADLRQTPAGPVDMGGGGPVLAELLAFMGGDYEIRMQGGYGALFKRVSP